jgi:hypothetical protein
MYVVWITHIKGNDHGSVCQCQGPALGTAEHPPIKILGIQFYAGVDWKVEICTNRNGKLVWRQFEHQSLIRAKKSFAYVPACGSKLFDSP